MRLPPLVSGRFVRRDNRFRVAVMVGGEQVAAHLPNSGRLTELLVAGRPCWLTEFDDPHRKTRDSPRRKTRDSPRRKTRDSPRRKTRFDLTLVAYAGRCVSVDARLPNALFAEAFAAGELEPFRSYDRCQREVKLGESRLDFRLSGPAGVAWVEVKSVTLVEDGIARFPDAPTARGARHVRELAVAVQSGAEAAIVFVIQRPDARAFAPHDEADAAFGIALREAADAGVGVYAWVCAVGEREITIAEQIPVELT